MLVFTAIACFIISGALSMEPGARNQTGIQGTDVNLTCTNKTWSEIFFVIWNITLHNRECTISLKDDGQSRNTCGGNWALLNTSSGEPYLLIPNISPHDEGLYECQVAYKEGTHSVNISLILLVSPRVSAWLKWQGSKRVAVCVAEKGKPAASVHWRISGNLTTPQTKPQELPGGFYTVRSVLELPEDTAEENVTCVVNHPSWEEEHTIRAVHLRCAVWWVLLLIPAVLGLAGLYLGRRRLTALRHCGWSGCKSSQEVASPSIDDVEELEPYASYFQKINFIYNPCA